MKRMLLLTAPTGRPRLLAYALGIALVLLLGATKNGFAQKNRASTLGDDRPTPQQIGTNIVRMTQEQIDNLTNPETGFLVFNITANELQINLGGPFSPLWVSLTGEGGGQGGPPAWLLGGNSITGEEVLGTTNAQNLTVITDNTPRITVEAETGNIGIGTTDPEELLEVRNGNILISSSGFAGELRFQEDGEVATDYSAFRAGFQEGTITYILPENPPLSNQVLTAFNEIDPNVFQLEWSFFQGGAFKGADDPNVEELQQRVDAQQEQLVALEQENTQLKARLARLEQILLVGAPPAADASSQETDDKVRSNNTAAPAAVPNLNNQ